MKKRHAALLASLLVTGCSVLGIRSGYEQPGYQVLEELTDRVEVRRYSARLAAETTVDAADPESARGDAFRILAGYIFGGNRPAESISMTAPVQVEEEAARISMTAPVETESKGQMLVMRFFMPGEYTKENLPEPTDPRVRIVEVPGETVAALRFSGLGRGTARERREAELQDAVSASRWRASGEVSAFYYDPPFTLPFLRRNEVIVPVAQ